MTALIFNLHPDQVIIAMDTMSTTIDGKPNGYTSKFFPVQHLNGLMCVTGLSNFALDWLASLLRFVAKDMVHLDEFVTPVLQRLWRNYESSVDCTATAYHFGYSREEQRYVGFAYRSTNSFESERLGYGWRTKPGIPDLKIEILSDISNAVRMQRAAQAQEPFEKRIFIGGEIQLAILERQTITISTMDRFEDYNEVYDVICEQFPIED